MKKFNLKEHNDKLFELSKKAASGTYPNKKVASIGSFAGIVIGMLLLTVGGVGIVIKSIWGVGSALAGAVTIVSNVINLKRTK